jgi:hypothetical protein
MLFDAVLVRSWRLTVSCEKTMALTLMSFRGRRNRRNLRRERPLFALSLPPQH